MSTNLRLEPSAKQSTVLAPRVIQNIKLLELPADSLTAHLRDLAERNLFIDPDRLESALAEEEGEQILSTHPGLTVRSPGSLLQGATHHIDGSNHDTEVERLVSTRTDSTLSAHLLWQLGALSLDGTTRARCHALVHSLNEQGFLEEPDRCALAHAFGTQHFDEALALVQSLDPPGVATSGMQECLLSQIPRTKKNKRLLTLIERHFPALVRGNIATIKRSMALSNDDFAALLNQIRTLTIIPSRGFAPKKEPRLVTCDLAILPLNGSSMDVSLYGTHILRADLFNSAYVALRTDADTPREIKGLLDEHRTEALAALHGIRQRHTAISLLGHYLAERQSDFFLHGPHALKPLAMQEAADDLGISVAAISRATKDKYVATPFGARPLRQFFSHAVVGAAPGNEAISQATLSSHIAELVRSENPRSPLSDEAIARELAMRHDVTLSRRTIAKYRAKMGIPACSKRRVAKSLF